MTKDDIYANRIFLNAALPLLKVIVDSNEAYHRGFVGKYAKIQISALHEGGKVGTHYDIDDGKWTVVLGVTEDPDVELEFKSIPALNAFFSGKSKKLPKLKGWYKLGLFIPFLKVLLAMNKLLSAKTPPKKEEDQQLLVKLYFYLLSNGISQLNKAQHPKVSRWAKRSPDRVYAWRVIGHPELSAYIRVKAGKSKSARGEYKRSKPFFTMAFDTIPSALGILLQTDDLFQATAEGRLIMEGAPEFGAEIGDFMLTIAEYAT